MQFYTNYGSENEPIDEEQALFLLQDSYGGGAGHVFVMLAQEHGYMVQIRDGTLICEHNSLDISDTTPHQPPCRG